MTIGEKIKAARIERSLTQSELVDGRITRNMLSAIENGKANPSMETVAYLAERLNLPASYLLANDDDKDFYIKKELMPQIKKAFIQKKYHLCESLISKIEDLDDDLFYILANINFELGKKAVLSGELNTAKSYLEYAKTCCSKTFFDTSAIQCMIPVYYALASNIASPLLEFDDAEFKQKIGSLLDWELYRYMLNDLEYEYENPLYRLHFTAKKMIKERKYIDAIKVLTEAEESKSTSGYNAYAVFGVYSDLELCYKQILDFENAYKYASKRLSLLDAFNA